MAEKTKAELLSEINADLEKKNESLLSEVRGLKSNMTRYEAMKDKLENFSEVQSENANLKAQILNLNKQIEIQSKQIDVLLNGLNQANNAVSRYFDNLSYMMQLAKENYDKTFGSIQAELNKIIQDLSIFRLALVRCK